MKLINVLKYNNRLLDNCTSLPHSIFTINNIVIPLYKEKLSLFTTLQSISFSSNRPSLLHTSIETIFNALYQFKVVAFTSH